MVRAYRANHQHIKNNQNSTANHPSSEFRRGERTNDCREIHSYLQLERLIDTRRRTLLLLLGARCRSADRQRIVRTLLLAIARRQRAVRARLDTVLHLHRGYGACAQSCVHFVKMIVCDRERRTENRTNWQNTRTKRNETNERTVMRRRARQRLALLAAHRAGDRLHLRARRYMVARVAHIARAKIRQIVRFATTIFESTIPTVTANRAVLIAAGRTAADRVVAVLVRFGAVYALIVVVVVASSTSRNDKANDANTNGQQTLCFSNNEVVRFVFEQTNQSIETHCANAADNRNHIQWKWLTHTHKNRIFQILDGKKEREKLEINKLRSSCY
jgi:hypothetical protein